ncbi:MAG: hypothetical protein FD167_442 [bacterium]|nr:MAG: hypothetical protein FD167_442 [bacterium]
MDDKQNNIFEMLKRVNNFVSLYKSSFSPNSLAIELFNTIKKTVEEVANLTITQASNTSSTKQGVTKKATLRENLRQSMETISYTARGIAVRVPGTDNKFRMPIGNNDGILLTTAQVFARDVVEFKNEFAKRELEKVFFDEFNANIKAFEQATKDKNASKNAQVVTRASINQAMEQGILAFREVDAIVRNKFRNESNILSQWATASHVLRQTRSSKKTKTKVTEQSKENNNNN